MLENYNVEWIQMNGEEFASILQELAPQAAAGLVAIASRTERSSAVQLHTIEELRAESAGPAEYGCATANDSSRLLVFTVIV